MKRWQIVGLCLFAILAVGAVALIRWMRPYDLETEERAARAAGIPLTVAELRIPAPPEKENAAIEYRALQALLKRRPLDTEAIDAASRKNASLARMDARTTAALRKLVSGRPDVAHLLHAAAARPHLYFRFDWTPYGISQQMAEIAALRQAAKWIRWESALMARDGRYADAVRNQALGFRIARQAAEEPMLISWLLANACEGITLRGCQDILSMAGPNASVAGAVRLAIASGGQTGSLAQSLKSEVVYGLTTLHEFGTVEDPTRPETARTAPGSGPASGSKLFAWWFVNPSRAVYIHWMTRTIQAAQSPAGKRAVAMKAVEQAMLRQMGSRPTAALTAILLPSLTGAGSREAQTMARRTLVSTMAAVLAYRARTGRYPAALSEAVSPVPEDPYTGKPIGYRREGTGFTLSAQPDVTGEDPKSAAKWREYSTIRYPPEP